VGSIGRVRPVIGITTRPRPVATPDGELPAHTLIRPYRDAVVGAGAVPILLAPVVDDDVATVVDRIDGLVLTGRGDIDPARYGGVLHDTMYGIDQERDGFEWRLVAEAKARRTPTLAICRGMQVVNVALGGSLIEDLGSQGGGSRHVATGDDVYAAHQRVRLEENCRLADVVGATEVKVNSIHHQAVRRLGAGLRTVGVGDDGIVEAIEHEDREWMLLAVQWHPEFLAQVGDAPAQALFAALARAALAV
jgi:putative glutamine amidotransferase